jgi:signal transduction histidine kinase
MELKQSDLAFDPSQSSVEELEDTFDNWDKEKLIAYALSVTKALATEQDAVKNLTTQYTTAQNWALGLALVEEIGRGLASTLDLNEVLTELLSRTYNIMEVEDGSVLLLEEGSGDLISQVILGSLAKATKPFRIPKGQGIAGQVAESGVPTIVNNAKDDPRHFTKIDEDTGFVTESILCVPLLTRDKIVGVLEVFNKQSGPFTEQDEQLLSSIANYAAIAIENAQLHQSVVEERNHVIQVQQEVSHKLQRDLHDGPTQLVAAIQMGLDFTLKAMEHNEYAMATEEMGNMLQLAERASHQMRTLLFELRPLVLKTKGLVVAAEMYLTRRQEEEERTKLHLVCNADTPDGEIDRMKEDVEAALFAIIQESVNNALKHAKANNIFVRLTQEHDHLTVTIADDGVGFDVRQVIQNYEDRGSYGMVNLRERVAIANGDYTINSAPGEGTEIVIHVPLATALAE